MRWYAFSGASCAGKTSIIKILSKEFGAMGYRVAVINESFREVLTMYQEKLPGKGMLVERARINEDVYYKIEELALDLHFSKLMQVRQADIVLVDRPALDYILYSMNNMSFPKWGELFIKYYAMIRDEFNRYSRIFVMDRLGNEQDIRAKEDLENGEYHFKVLSEWAGWKGVMVTGSFDERLEKIRKTIDSDLRKCVVIDLD